MVYLVEVNGSKPSWEALQYAAERCREPQRDPGASELVLLHVVPSARTAELESGRRLLANCSARCQRIAAEVTVRTRLEVGDRLEHLARMVEQLNADCVVLGSHDATEFPHLRALGAAADAAVSRISRPVIVVGREGEARRHSREEAADGPRG